MHGGSSLDSSPWMWLLLIVVVILFIWFWSHLEPELRRMISWVIVFSCIGVVVLVLANVPH